MKPTSIIILALAASSTALPSVNPSVNSDPSNVNIPESTPAASGSDTWLPDVINPAYASIADNTGVEKREADPSRRDKYGRDWWGLEEFKVKREADADPSRRDKNGRDWWGLEEFKVKREADADPSRRDKYGRDWWGLEEFKKNKRDAEPVRKDKYGRSWWGIMGF